jgi:NAD(P)H-flavin reductase
VIELVVHAPMAARRFRPGQFFRLQDYEADAPLKSIAGIPTRLAMEGLAATGAWVDAQAGLVATVILACGASSELSARLRPGQRVILMGPTGTPTQIPSQQTVVLVGGGVGNAALFSIGAACRAQGSRVLYFAAYRRADDCFSRERVEAAADTVVWCCDQAPGLAPRRTGDVSFVGNVVEALLACARGGLGNCGEMLRTADRLIVLGSDRMMAAVAAARSGALAAYMPAGQLAIASVNSPMQCMLKEVCGQCLQQVRDPKSGGSHWVFSCAEQDQALECVDFAMLRDRLAQNALAERQSAAWLALHDPASTPA